jgi:DMSO/TMAO reductase YedYZ molybdopterin-dependent catalytic subunit
MSEQHLSRRRLLSLGGLSLGGLALAGCDRLSRAPSARGFLSEAERLTFAAQRTLLSRHALAREFTAADLSPTFRANGTLMPDTQEYERLLERRFADWRLTIDGLVQRPMSLSLAELQRLPSRTQITRHDCVEGWSAIGQWTGVQLGLLLKAAGLAPDARYLVFHCADNLGGEALKGGDQSAGRYYESIDLIDAFHPQTILAYRLNGAPLDIPHGAPLRLRVERQLGYKHAKYVMRIEAVRSFRHIAGGKGGYWEDKGYEWYAGI